MLTLDNMTADGVTYNPSTHLYLTASEHEKNKKLIAARQEAFNMRSGARVGDFLIVGGGYKRFTHDWDTGIQTTSYISKDGNCGSFYLHKDGFAEYSGGLHPSLDKQKLVDTGELLDGLFWVFSGDDVKAHNGINFFIPCRVFKLV